MRVGVGILVGIGVLVGVGIGVDVGWKDESGVTVFFVSERKRVPANREENVRMKRKNNKKVLRIESVLYPFIIFYEFLKLRCRHRMQRQQSIKAQ